MVEILFGLFIATAVSGLVPVVNAELVVVAAAAAVPLAGVPVVAAVSTLGQMTTKGALFAVARWAPSRLPRRATGALHRVERAVAERRSGTWTLVFTSAVTGLPPFYGVSLAAGALRVRPVSFLSAGFAGRLVRFGALAAAACGLLGG